MTSAIGPYLIEKRLGLGGMAEVFLARKRVGNASKHVVVKRMLPELNDDPKFREMFLREGRILAQLDHPNVVHIVDLGAGDDGTLYIAMEFLDGISVHELAVKAWKARVPLPLELCVRVVAEAARGLAYVHTKRGASGEPLGLVHRDVAPDNLFFAKDGAVKLLDFGVARSSTMTALTKRGEVKGKVPYLSPEALESVTLDGRSDVFSLGVTAFWLLTGQRPFRAQNDLGVIRAILRTKEPVITSLNPDVPEWLAALVHRMLEKNPLERVQTCAEIETTIARHFAHAIDRARDVAFVEDVLTRPKLDDATLPVPAVRRVPSGVFARAKAGSRPAGDAIAGAGGEAPPSRPRAKPKPVSALDAEPVSDAMIEGELDEFDMSATIEDSEPRGLPASVSSGAVTKPNPPAPAQAKPPRSPLPRAVHIDMPVEIDDPSGDTVRLTDSQLGVKSR